MMVRNIPRICDGMASLLPHTATGAQVRPYRTTASYPPIGGCLCFLSCISVSLSQLVSHVGQPLNSIFTLSTFRADPQFMYINILFFSPRIYILLPLLLCPCLAP